MIDIRDYDIALLGRFRAYFENTYWVQRPNISISEIRDQKIIEGSDIIFPALVLRRTSCPIIQKENNSWSRYNSGSTYYSGNSSFIDKTKDLNIIDNKTSLKLKYDKHDNIVYDDLCIVNSTFSLVYYLDILSFERDNFDTIMVETQENILRNPFISFDNIKENGETDKLIQGQSCHLDLDEVEDNTYIEDFDSKNALYRATLTLKLNAYIYRKQRVPSINKVILEHKVFSSENVNPAYDENGEPIIDKFKGVDCYKIYSDKVVFE